MSTVELPHERNKKRSGERITLIQLEKDKPGKVRKALIDREMELIKLSTEFFDSDEGYGIEIVTPWPDLGPWREVDEGYYESFK